MKLKQAIVVFDIDGVVRDVGGSYRRALADTVEHYTQEVYRPSQEDIDTLKSEGIWNNDWEASQEMIQRYFKAQGKPIDVTYDEIVAFFQSRYRGGTDPQNWTGYICTEPLLVSPAYFDRLTDAGIKWGFFSGATRMSATYVLERRLGIQPPVLIAMEDAPGKPDPTGLIAAIEQLGATATDPVFYIGDTVADLYAVENAAKLQPDRPWIGIGVLPPHVQDTIEHQIAYAQGLETAGAVRVLSNMEELTPELIWELMD
ncbi:MAG: TIGR01548 family HAD-type hydrolase [Leptolyngbyaceae cyanobacterium bins.59]|nr:TIGR01548 family HAD-type hydrolase [Leptolyngbyaceae cyanobacterium bins.59]